GSETSTTAIELCPRLPTYAQRSASASAELRPRALRSSWPTSCSVAVWSAARLLTGSRSQTASAGNSAFSRALAASVSPCLLQRMCASSTKIMPDRTDQRAAAGTRISRSGVYGREPGRGGRSIGSAAHPKGCAQTEVGCRREREPRQGRMQQLAGDAEAGQHEERPCGALGDQRTDQKPRARDQVSSRRLDPAVYQQQSEGDKQSCTGCEAMHQVHGEGLYGRLGRPRRAQRPRLTGRGSTHVPDVGSAVHQQVDVGSRSPRDQPNSTGDSRGA